MRKAAENRSHHRSAGSKADQLPTSRQAESVRVKRWPRFVEERVDAGFGVPGRIGRDQRGMIVPEGESSDASSPRGRRKTTTHGSLQRGPQARSASDGDAHPHCVSSPIPSRSRASAAAWSASVERLTRGAPGAARISCAVQLNSRWRLVASRTDSNSTGSNAARSARGGRRSWTGGFGSWAAEGAGESPACAEDSGQLPELSQRRSPPAVHPAGKLLNGYSEFIGIWPIE